MSASSSSRLSVLDGLARWGKYRHYLFVTCLLAMGVSVLALLNGYVSFVNVTSYNLSQQSLSWPFSLAGYLGMFMALWISPVPDYVLVPAYGLLSALGIFNPYTTFIVCLAAALVPIEYAAGRLVPRQVLLGGLHYVHVSEKDLEAADKWLAEHGRFSILLATFIPFFYSVSAVAAGTLKMGVAEFFLASTAGFAARYIVLEYAGYFSVYIFTASFDYSQRALFASLLVLTCVYAAVYLMTTRRSRERMELGSRPIVAAGP